MTLPQSPGPAGSVDLAARYGAPGRLRSRAVLAAVAVVVVAGLVWLAWVVLVQGRPLVRSEIVSFDATGEHSVDVSFTVVRRSADVEASCLLRALASDHTIVGELDVPVGPGGAEQSTLSETVRTERLATSVDVLGCTATGQRQRR